MKNMRDASIGEDLSLRRLSERLNSLICTTASMTYRNLFKNDMFESIDRNAFMVSKNISESLDDLIKNLFFSTTFDDLMKIRSIFAWLSFVDVEKVEFHCDKHGMELCKALNCLKFGGSYSEAFMLFASYVEIRTVCIKGWAKGSNCLPSNMRCLPANHSWNAVEIQKKWFLLDCYWSKSVSKDGMQEIEDFYFFVDPKMLIYSHFPESTKWQLLTEPISFESFIDMPALKPDFFKLQLNFCDCLSPVVSRNGLIISTLLHKGNTFFKYKIQKVGSLKRGCNDLKHLIFEELSDNRVTYYFQVPESGRYILKIFASNEGYLIQNKYVAYKEVVEFMVNSEASTSITPLPITTDACWGIEKPYLKYLQPSMSPAIFILKSNEKRFSIPKLGRTIFLKFCPPHITKANVLVKHLEENKFSILLNEDVPDICGIEIYVADIKCSTIFYFIGQFMICSENSFIEKHFLNQFHVAEKISLPIDKTSNNETIDKLREIFLFASEGHNGSLLNNSTLLTLDKIDSREITRAQAFEHLCRNNGYPCITIPGILKSGKHDVKSGSNHTWNAVLVDGTWNLVDCGSKRNGEALKEQEKDVQFLTDPKYFIYTHFPLDLKWQLLESPISYEDFLNLVNVKPAFHNLNLSLEQPLHNDLDVNGKTEIIIKQNVKSKISFTHSLFYLDDPKTQLDDCIIQHEEDDLMKFKLRLPMKGSYLFKVFAKEIWDEEINYCEEICEFKIKNHGSDDHSNFFVPSSGHLGYSDFAKRHSIKCSHELPFLETSTGIANISVSAPEKFKFHVELKDVAGKTVDCVTLIRRVNNIDIIASCPDIGEYCLKVYANDLEITDSVLHMVLQICVVFSKCSRDSTNQYVNTFSKLPFGFLGSQPCNKIFGTIFLSDSDLVIPRGNIVKLFFYDRVNLKFYFNLWKIDGCKESNHDFSSFVLKQKKENMNIFIVVLPSKGNYVFQLYASKCGDSYLNAYNVLISCSELSDLPLEFPDQLSSWNGFIYSPLQKYLNKENIAKFELEMADASNISFITESRSIPFSLSDGIWSLRANLQEFDRGCQVKICSQVPDSIVHELLEYIII